MPEPEPSPFAEIVAELADGQRWALLRADGWDDFIERLTALVAELEPRRRQALVMLLFALVDGRLDPDDARAHLDAVDLESDEGVDALIAWLRRFRPDAGR